MTAAWAHIRVRQGKRWREEAQLLGLEDERLLEIEGEVAEYFIEHRSDFGLIEIALKGQPRFAGAGLKGLALRLLDSPDLVYVLALRSGEIAGEDLARFRALFDDKL